jgi:hypothetical protein
MNGKFAVGLIILGAVAWSSVAAAQNAYTQEEQDACTGDAFRLCSEAIPDVDRITECLKVRRVELSPPCARMFEPGRDRHLR